MQAEGIVVRLVGARAYVKIKRSGGCGRCHEVGGCGGVGQDDAHCEEFVVDNSFGAQNGQRVSVDVPEGATLTAALLAYGMPLLAILLGAGLASWLWQSDVAVALGAGGALGHRDGPVTQVPHVSGTGPAPLGVGGGGVLLPAVSGGLHRRHHHLCL